MSKLTGHYHQSNGYDPAADSRICIEAVVDGDNIDANHGPYFRLSFGFGDLTIYMEEHCLRELARLIDAMPPLPKVNPPAAIQSEACATAQPEAE